MTEMINTIINARIRQKEQIEGSETEKSELLASAQKQAEPFLQAMDTQTEQLTRAIQQRQQIPQILQQEQPLQHIAGPSQPITWIQRLVQESLGRESARVPFEINIETGQLGRTGKVQLDQLFNYGKIIITRNNEVIFRDDSPSKGLAAMLLLSVPKMRKLKIKPTARDSNTYIDIMNSVQFEKRGPSKKLSEYLKKPKKREDIPMDVDEATPDIKTGTGVFPYKNKEDLESRLSLLAGSIRAGNTSHILKDEMRSILDELLELKALIPAMHERFYNRYHL